ncbi:IS30 family transposase [Kineococcus xinjiangensis]
MPGARLGESERVRIEAWWVAGWSIPQMATALGRDRSTVWREIKRNNSARHGPKHGGRALRERLERRRTRRGGDGLYRWGYQARRAQIRADARARRPRGCKLGFEPNSRGRGWCPQWGVGTSTLLRRTVVNKLARRWSPQQISAWLRENFPDQPELQVSHETIYQAIYVQGRGNLRAELTRQVALRSGRAVRRHQSEVAGVVHSRRPWAAGFNISTRPPEAADRAVPGHWEGDLIIGKNNASAVITLVERSTRYVLLGQLPAGRGSDAVVEVLSTLAQRLPAHLLRSLTWDNGSEMAAHAGFTIATGCPVFFADPHHPWQRGSNENTNGLLRQYYPKGSDLSRHTQADLDATAAELNDRPRQTLSWQTPRQALHKVLVATAG